MHLILFKNVYRYYRILFKNAAMCVANIFFSDHYLSLLLVGDIFFHVKILNFCVVDSVRFFLLWCVGLQSCLKRSPTPKLTQIFSQIFLVVVQLLSPVRLFATLWTIARQTPLKISQSLQIHVHVFLTVLLLFYLSIINSSIKSFTQKL